MNQNERALENHYLRDLFIVLGTGTLCLFVAYQLINGDFLFIYLACFMLVAIAGFLLSTPWLKNAFLSLGALLVILSLAEGVLSLAEPRDLNSDRKAAGYTKGYSQPLRRNSGELGYEPYPSRSVQSWKYWGNEKLYDVVYTINDQGFRHTPGNVETPPAMEPAVFFGGSFAFGEGVDDDETLPYFLAAAIGWSRPVLNLGFSGYGPHQMLRALELGTLGTMGYPEVDVVIYEAVPDHARRGAGEVWWDPVGPRYGLNEQGALEYQGRFTNVPDSLIRPYYRYLQAVTVARRSRVVDWTANLLFGTQTTDPASQVALMVEIVAQAAALVQMKYKGDFLVLFWDDESKESAMILEGLSEKGIVTIKVTDMIPLVKLPSYQIANDAHPTAAANQIIADGLVERLGRVIRVPIPTNSICHMRACGAWNARSNSGSSGKSRSSKVVDQPAK